LTTRSLGPTPQVVASGGRVVAFWCSPSRPALFLGSFAWPVAVMISKGSSSTGT
jgi:hypothetical protein